METNTKVVTTVVVLVALALAGMTYYQSNTSVRNIEESDDDLVFCTADAFQCPDGTWVGRTGPDCEFICP